MTNQKPRTAKECWLYNRDLERIEGVRRCSFCGAREDKHNLPADMAYYGYTAHEFQYPSQALRDQWLAEEKQAKEKK